MSEITEAGLRLLQAVTQGELAWSAPDALVAAVSLDREAALDMLADLHVGGWLEVWESPEGLRVTLTPRAASHLGVRIAEVGPRLQPRWVRGAGPSRSRSAVRTDRCGGAPGCSPERLDPSPPPNVAAERFEESSRREGPASARPTLLIGQRLCPWPGPTQIDPAAPCPGCAGAKLAPEQYCLRCDEWGGTHATSGGPARRAARGHPGQPSRGPRLRDQRGRRGARLRQGPSRGDRGEE